MYSFIHVSYLRYFSIASFFIFIYLALIWVASVCSGLLEPRGGNSGAHAVICSAPLHPHRYSGDWGGGW